MHDPIERTEAVGNPALKPYKKKRSAVKPGTDVLAKPYEEPKDGKVQVQVREGRVILQPPQPEVKRQKRSRGGRKSKQKELENKNKIRGKKSKEGPLVKKKEKSREDIVIAVKAQEKPKEPAEDPEDGEYEFVIPIKKDVKASKSMSWEKPTEDIEQQPSKGKQETKKNSKMPEKKPKTIEVGERGEREILNDVKG
ncbi:hypothetical protein RB195_005517 [Necator americanus]|nr:hypothetical protein NECAME_01062 [Necator americanus]ETN70114.1 hypothetical protein NECAME_01062 [Necator americanus]